MIFRRWTRKKKMYRAFRVTHDLRSWQEKDESGKWVWCYELDGEPITIEEVRKKLKIFIKY